MSASTSRRRALPPSDRRRAPPFVRGHGTLGRHRIASLSRALQPRARHPHPSMRSDSSQAGPATDEQPARTKSARAPTGPEPQLSAGRGQQMGARALPGAPLMALTPGRLDRHRRAHATPESDAACPGPGTGSRDHPGQPRRPGPGRRRGTEREAATPPADCSDRIAMVRPVSPPFMPLHPPAPAASGPASASAGSGLDSGQVELAEPGMGPSPRAPGLSHDFLAPRPDGSRTCVDIAVDNFVDCFLPTAGFLHRRRP